jgi:ABC-type branched-subunit amino acid transport system substrate-binding protein
MSRFMIAGMLVLLHGCTEEEGGTVTPPPPDNTVNCAVDTAATPVILGAALSLTGSANPSQASCGDQPDLAKKVINDGCGVLGTLESGTPVDMSVFDMRDNATDAASAPAALLAAGAVAVVANSADPAMVAAVTANFEGATPPLLPWDITSPGPEFNRCSPEQLTDGTTQVSHPTRVAGECFFAPRAIRTAGDSRTWGEQGVQYAVAAYSATRIAMAARDTGTLIKALEAGDAYLNSHSVPSLLVTHSVATPPRSDWVTIYIPAMLAHNPDAIIVGLSAASFQNFVEAWIEYGADPANTKPANYDTMPILAIQSLAGVDFSSYSVDARDLIDTRIQSFQQYWDESTPGWQSWYDLWTDFYPEKTTPTNFVQMAVFDGWLVYALAINKAGSTDPDDIAAAIDFVANAPGTQYYPHQFKEARAAILRGEDIDYEGAIIHDLDHFGMMGGLSAYAVYDFDAAGVPTPTIVAKR